MGLAIPSLVVLLAEHKARPFSGTLLQIGRQDIYFDYDTLLMCAAQLGVTLNTVEQIGLRPNEWMPGVKTIDDVTLFESFGFTSVKSADTSDYEQADVIHDFNKPIPSELHGQFDVVFDGGSLEHIFHLPHALENFCRLLKPGGRVIHHSPTHNFVDHGFFCFSPTFFHDYYEANHFIDVRSHLVGMRPPFRRNDVPVLFPYSPGMLESVSLGGMSKEKFRGCDAFVTAFSATKTADSEGTVIPMQRRYREWWAKAKAGMPLSSNS